MHFLALVGSNIQFFFHRVGLEEKMGLLGICRQSLQKNLTIIPQCFFGQKLMSYSRYVCIPNSTPSKKELLNFSHVLGSFFSAHNLSIVCNMYHLRQQRKLSNLVKFTSSISFMYNFVSCLLFSSFLDQVHMHFQRTFTLKNCYFQNRKNGLTNLNCDQCLKCQMID